MLCLIIIIIKRMPLKRNRALRPTIIIIIANDRSTDRYYLTAAAAAKPVAAFYRIRAYLFMMSGVFAFVCACVCSHQIAGKLRYLGVESSEQLLCGCQYNRIILLYKLDSSATDGRCIHILRIPTYILYAYWISVASFVIYTHYTHVCAAVAVSAGVYIMGLIILFTILSGLRVFIIFSVLRFCYTLGITDVRIPGFATDVHLNGPGLRSLSTIIYL